MSELLSDSDGIQENMAESTNTERSKINPKQQLEQVQLKKKEAFIKYQSQQRDKNSQDQDIFPPGTCVIMADLILNRLIEENICKEHNDRIRKFPGATMGDLNHHVHPVPGKKTETHHYSHKNKLCHPFNI